MKYDVDYFIKKFESIPDNKWTTEVTFEGNKKCALGHCRRIVNGLSYSTPESKALWDIFSNVNILVPEINDNYEYKFTHFGDTPKERILVALYNIKGMLS